MKTPRNTRKESSFWKDPSCLSTAEEYESSSSYKGVVTLQSSKAICRIVAVPGYFQTA